MNFELRKWTINDLDNLVKHANNRNIANFLTNQFPYPYTNEAGKSFLLSVVKEEVLTIFAIDIGGQTIGSIGIFPQTDIHSYNAELGYWLSEEYWGKGIMTEAIKRIINYAFDVFEVNRIYARPFGTNIASQKVLQKSGFVLEASFEKTLFKNGEFIDEMVFAIRK